MKKYLKKYWPLAVAVILIVLNCMLTFKDNGHKNKGDGTKVKVDSTVYVDTIPYLVLVQRTL